MGGPLRFPDLTDSFLETEQNLTEVLLSKLQQELSEYLLTKISISNIHLRADWIVFFNL